MTTTREELLELAREAGAEIVFGDIEFTDQELERFAALLSARQAQPLSEQNARFAIDAAIGFGAAGVNKPPSDDHWLMPFWEIGRQLARQAQQEQPVSGADQLAAIRAGLDAAMSQCERIALKWQLVDGPRASGAKDGAFECYDYIRAIDPATVKVEVKS